LLKSAKTASVQSKCDQFTGESISANVFGVPWYVIDGEGFWSQNRLDFVERAFAPNEFYVALGRCAYA